MPDPATAWCSACKQFKDRDDPLYETCQRGREASRRRRYESRLRSEVFAHYGLACRCCGGTDRLTIDHIDGDGVEHREELFGDSDKAGTRFHAWLIREGLPEGFQTLCWPCNSSKRQGDRCRLPHGDTAAPCRSAQEVAARFGVSVSTAYLWRRLGRIPDWRNTTPRSVPSRQTLRRQANLLLSRSKTEVPE